MDKQQLEAKMREALKRKGKPPEEINAVVNLMLNLRFMQTDQNRKIFYDQWKDTPND